MNKIAKFEKVSYEQFKKDWIGTLGKWKENHIKEIYDNIQLPKRATKGSAGYDFYMPTTMVLEKGKSILVPTGIRCKIKDSWVLLLYPRSGLGTKTGIRLANTTGVVDSDYYYSDNEGHIFVKLVNESVALGDDVALMSGERFCQGIFMPFGVTEDDDVKEVRNGGFGSTSK